MNKILGNLIKKAQNANKRSYCILQLVVNMNITYIN